MVYGSGFTTTSESKPQSGGFFFNAVCLKMDGIPNGLPSFWHVNTKHQTLK